MPRDEQINFRLQPKVTKKQLQDTLSDKQSHIPSQTALFQGVIDAVITASKSGRLIEWPIELVLKPKR